MRFCHECGVKVLDDEAKFCIECGANLFAEKNSPPPKTAPPAKTAPVPKNPAAVSVAKGQRVDLTKTNPAMKNLLVGLGWRAADGFDIDAAAFLLGANGKVLEETDFIFYNHPLHNSGAVGHLGDKTSDGDNEQFRVTLDKIPNAVVKISFTLTIHDAAQRRQSFGQVNDAFIRVADEASGKELLRYELGKNFSTETAIVVAEIYRHKGEWKFNAVGAGFSGGLAALCKNFGIDVAS
ncbi:MAG: TerD family protein [Selenomonadaceae bacterium]|nr:TerD family protein [Selenomonadaceae bacterium]